MSTKNLGLVKVIFKQATSPMPTDVLWYDTINKILKYFDITILSWIPLYRSQLFGGLTANTPTNAEITTVIGLTAVQAGVGFQATIFNTNDNKLYFIASDGVNWLYSMYSKIGIYLDVDLNLYHTVIIGNQEWMVENLKTTHYADGTPIPNLIATADWLAEDGTTGHDGAYCWYNNDITNKTPYGALYNGFATQNVHGLAPVGWQIVSYSDWNILWIFLGGVDIAGGALKEVGTVHWASPNTGATDQYGFKGLPTGNRYYNAGASFQNITVLGAYLTRNKDTVYPNYFYYVGFHNDDSTIWWESEQGRMGCAIRCLRYTPTGQLREYVDQIAWCAVGAIPSYWNYTDGGWSTDGSKLICDGTIGAIGNEESFACPSPSHVKITVSLVSGTLEAPFDGETSALLITSSGMYEYNISLAPPNGLYIRSNSFVGSITALSIKGVF